MTSGGKSDASNTWRISMTSPAAKGTRLAHSIASSFDFTWIIQNPAISSFSWNGPSVTVGAPRENLTRAPFELGWIPSPASRTPDFTISSLNRPIAATSSLLGRTPASVFLSARTSIMNRIVSPYRVSLWSLLGWPAGALTGATSRAPTLPRRALPHGPDFDGARTGQRNSCGDRNGFVEILDVDEHVAAELLAGLRERTVGHEPLAVAHPDAGRRRRRVQRRAAQILPARRQLLRELHALPIDLLSLGHAEPVPGLLVAANQQHVFHGALHQEVERPGPESTPSTKLSNMVYAPGCKRCRRRGLSLRVGPDRRHPEPARSRLRRRGRGGARGLCGRGGPVAGLRRPRVPARLDHPDGSAQGHRPHPPPDPVRGETGRLHRGRGEPDRRGAGVRSGRHPRRSASPDLHLLSPGAGARGPGRAHAPLAGRPRDGRDRARVPRADRDDGAAARAGEGQDSRRGHSVHGARHEGYAGPARRGADGDLPRLQRRLPAHARRGAREARSLRRGDPACAPRDGADRAAAAGGDGPPRPHAAARLAARHPPRRGRRPRHSRSAGPSPLESRPDRRGAAARRGGPARRPRAVRAPGGDRRPAL